MFVSVAPVIDKVGEGECEVSWLAAKPFAGDRIEYRLQLSQSLQGHASSLDYKQVGTGGTDVALAVRHLSRVVNAT